jgi:tartrate-resistant acid phosphatase type 5
VVSGRRSLAALILLLALPLPAQTVYTYIGQLTAESVLIAWGTAVGKGGDNTIGRASAPMGQARVKIGDKTLTTGKNWIEAGNLRPDAAYSYEVAVDGRRIGEGTFRTYPSRADSLVFFVIGDYGTGGPGQRAIAEAMKAEFEKRAATVHPVRFVLTLGDNIYANAYLGYRVSHSGADDRDWATKFFQPYAGILRYVPFYPTLGNHDGNATENRGDLAAYLDNFFFPENKPARWYRFSFGGLADFFALDSTDNTAEGHRSPVFAPEGEQSRWLAKVLADSKAPWKIPYFHHAVFNAGPGHGANYNVLRHWVDLFQKTGVKAVFNGHEHNMQVSEDDDATGHIRYFVSGAGGELRRGNVMADMRRAHIAAWAAQRHFLVVEIEGRTMRVTPMSNQKIVLRDAAGKQVPVPITITLP